MFKKEVLSFYNRETIFTGDILIGIAGIEVKQIVKNPLEQIWFHESGFVQQSYLFSSVIC